MREGDLIFSHGEEGYQVIKILKIWKESMDYHCMVYKFIDHQPTVQDIKKLEIFVWHAPIDGRSIEKEFKVFGHSAVTKDELQGYFFHLKMTDFLRYLKETNQKLDTVLGAAKKKYQDAYYLAKDGKLREAVEVYSVAIDIFPRFCEALDNRGGVKRQLGDLQGAAEDYKESLDVDPKNPFALNGLGICYLELKDYRNALLVLKKLKATAPDHPNVDSYIKEAIYGMALRNGINK